MTRQASRQFSMHCIPYHHLPSISPTTSTGHPPAIGTPSHTRYSPPMLFQALEEYPIRSRPQADTAIVPTTGQLQDVRAPRRAPHPGLRGIPNPAAGGCPHLPHLHATHIASTGQPASIQTPRHPLEDRVSVAGVSQHLQTCPRGCIPQTDRIIPPATGQQLPIRTPRHPIHSRAMSAQDPGLRPTSYLPKGHQHICPCTRQACPIRTPVDTIERDRIPRWSPAHERWPASATPSVPEQRAETIAH
jgi:hypothetical protein